MAITFSDEDLKYLSWSEYDTLVKYQMVIKNLKKCNDIRFCKKCGHYMGYSRAVIGMGVWTCQFCGAEEKI